MKSILDEKKIKANQKKALELLGGVHRLRAGVEKQSPRRDAEPPGSKRCASVLYCQHEDFIRQNSLY